MKFMENDFTTIQLAVGCSWERLQILKAMGKEAGSLLEMFECRRWDRWLRGGVFFLKRIEIVAGLQRKNPLIPLVEKDVSHRKDAGIPATGISRFFHP